MLVFQTNLAGSIPAYRIGDRIFPRWYSTAGMPKRIRRVFILSPYGGCSVMATRKPVALKLRVQSPSITLADLV